MNELAGRLEGNLLSVEQDDAREFEARLADSSALAVRVAYGVVRNRQDAEDVAQEAFGRPTGGSPRCGIGSGSAGGWCG